MIESECPDCGDRVFIFARTCPRCGTANEARMAGVWVAGALAMLAVAVVVAVVAVLRGHPLPIAGTPDAPVGEHVEASSASNFGWLTAAMSECETEAMKDLDTLYFLVLPLASLPLRSDDALEGLRSGTLRLYSGQYDFRIRDGADTVYKWKPSIGVTKISTPDARSIATFRLQFQTTGTVGEAEWGSPFTRQSGTCYWVNAIVGN